VDRAVISGGNLVEARCRVGDDAREHVEAARGALRVAATAHGGRQGEPLAQRHEVHGPALQRGAALERDSVDHQLAVARVGGIESRLNCLPVRKEAGPQLVRDGSEAEVEARRLELLVVDRRAGRDPARIHGGAECLIWQHTRARHDRRRVHERALSVALTAPSRSTASAFAALAMPTRAKASSIARATADASPSEPATTASSAGPAPLSTQPSAPALRAASATDGSQGKSRTRYGWCRRSSSAVPSTSARLDCSAASSSATRWTLKTA